MPEQPPKSPDSARTPEALLPLVYHELRALAGAMMARERRSHTLQATALVNEAYLKLVKGGQVSYEDRNHFFKVAATTLRRILVEHARGRNADKRGGDRDRVPLEQADGPEPSPSDARGTLDDAELIALDAAMQKLADEEPRYAQVVELRFFAGLTAEQAAEVLGISVETAHRDWRYAKARLRRWLSDAEGA